MELPIYTHSGISGLLLRLNPIKTGRNADKLYPAGVVSGNGLSAARRPAESPIRGGSENLILSRHIYIRHR